MQKPHNNKELFSNYYLEERLPNRDSWQEPEGLEEAYEKISKLYEKRKDILQSTKEAQTEEEWIKPILDVLGFKYITQPSESIFDTIKVPDYAFFLNGEDKRKAYKAAEDNKEELFDFALAVGDAKRWDRNLNELRPNKQIDEYLRITCSKWGILTNGRLWRIYHLDSSYRLDTYYEVDIVDLIEADSPEEFKYFYLFFRPNSFLEGGFLTEVYERSEDFTASVSEDLKENAFDALRELCQGFLSGNPELGEDDLDDIYENSLVLLYRLIFLLYAESEKEENLLPMDNETYRETYSLQALKEEVVEKQKSNSLLSSSHQYWSHLRDLFSFIDKGEETLGVYEYNGGLFDSDRHPFFKDNSIGDKYIAEAIRKVSYSGAEGGFIDYQDLDVRELGAIYEGLLEHKPVIEEEKVQWEEDLSERKKTGSYYTPEYIVKYIVENTIGPLVEEKKEEIKGEIEELKEKLEGSRGYDRETYQRKLEEKRKEVREEILELKVLDPAMGSGHFLVEATEKLANSIASLEEEFFPEEEEETTGQVTEREDTVKELKRQIVERSIYGVDKNPLATELAKLSLWLHTVAKGEPLSFLNHHLRTGDSLIGIDMEEMKTMPSEREQMAGLFTSNLVQDLGKAIGHLNLIEKITSGSRDDVQEKKAEWRDVKEWVDKYKKAANVRLSTSFENEVSDDEYRDVLQAAANEDIKGVSGEQFFQKAQEIAETKSFFHWELEFPDVFRNEKGKEKKTPGFDVVIGNPPYISVTNIPPYLRNYTKNRYQTAKGRFDTYILFWEKSAKLSKQGAFIAQILPIKWAIYKNGRPMRNLILDDVRFDKLCNISQSEVFLGATTYPSIPVVKNIKEQNEKVEVINIKNDPETIINRSSLKVNEAIENIPIKRFEKTPQRIICPYLTDINWKIFSKMMKRGTNLGEIYNLEQAIRMGGEDVRENLITSNPPSSEETYPLVDGKNISRYSINWNGKYLIYQPENLYNPKTRELLKQNKLLVKRIAPRLTVAYDDKQNGKYTFPLNTVYTMTSCLKREQHLFHTGLLNSKLLDWLYKLLFSAISVRGGYIEYREYLKYLPLLEKSKNEKQNISSLVSRIRKLKDEIGNLNTNFVDYLGHYSDGKSLSDLYRPVKGLSGTMLTKTSKDFKKLQINDVNFEENKNYLTLFVSARFKPKKEAKYETDRWGYTKTGFIPAMQFSVTDRMKTLIKEFVPLAIKKGSGFADFRRNATKTISLLDRLENLTLPKSADVGSGLQKYIKQKEKAEKLEKEIQKTDHQIDALVFDLYDLSEDEVRTVLDSLETPEDEKSDILKKCHQVS